MELPDLAVNRGEIMEGKATRGVKTGHFQTTVYIVFGGAGSSFFSGSRC
jgi:hypothetical protein